MYVFRGLHAFALVFITTTLGCASSSGSFEEGSASALGDTAEAPPPDESATGANTSPDGTPRFCEMRSVSQFLVISPMLGAPAVRLTVTRDGDAIRGVGLSASSSPWPYSSRSDFLYDATGQLESASLHSDGHSCVRSCPPQPVDVTITRADDGTFPSSPATLPLTANQILEACKPPPP